MDEKSVGEKGIFFVEMNRFSCLNVKKGFIKDYNVFKDFYESEILVYILVVWM